MLVVPYILQSLITLGTCEIFEPIIHEGYPRWMGWFQQVIVQIYPRGMG